MATHIVHSPTTPRPILGISTSRLATARGVYSPHLARSRRTVNARIMWQIDRALSALFKAGRRSVAILDTGCGNGKLLVKAALRARAIGFVAIEAKGLDRSADKVASAGETAAAIHDPAIGMSFAVRSDAAPLPIEEDETFDVTLTDAVDGRALAAELARVTERGGRVIRHD